MERLICFLSVTDHHTYISLGTYKSSDILSFAEQISDFAPQMALDFILEWAGNFSCATNQTIYLEYLTHWMRLLERFIDPSDKLYNKEKLRKCIRVLVNITVQYSEVSEVRNWIIQLDRYYFQSFVACQRYIWSQVANYSSFMLAFILEELIDMAISYGPESERCEIMARTLTVWSTKKTRKILLTKLRSVCCTDYHLRITELTNCIHSASSKLVTH